jgi:hypothetical protein
LHLHWLLEVGALNSVYAVVYSFAGPRRRVGRDWAAISFEDVMDMRRYLLVLDMDLLALDEELDLEPINYLVARQEQEWCEVVVLSPVAIRQAKLPWLELLLGAAAIPDAAAPARFPGSPQPRHDINAAAEHRMNLAVRHLRTIGCQASGLISDEELVKAVGAETRRHDYDEVILATGRQGAWLSRSLHLDPIHRLRRRWGRRLTVFTSRSDTKPNQ